MKDIKLAKLLKSKTILFGLLLTIFGGLESQLGLLQPIFVAHPQYFGYATVVIGLIVKGLRFLTTVPLQDK